ncbi:unnamed protein product [Rotaria sordida]|uniref:Uncharacterized protein n=1 Tax=Rotaria sordida TaxID=392033 RepID=A0A819CFS9_9BILA|nr:unnamed protein product [Rotaria sordida]CAF3818305.1 unnamed protein product [Rotaria sordida]
MTWSNDGPSSFLELGEEGSHVIYQAANVLTVVNFRTCHDVNLRLTDNKILLATHDNFLSPINIALITNDGTTPITTHSDQLIAKIYLSYGYKQFSFLGARNKTVSGCHLPLVNFTVGKVPLAFLIHGGPPNSWYETWSREWNFQAFAAQE